MTEQLAERRATILRAIVREFIRTGEPVGSKHLVDRSRFPISPATVRNEMARLEELGFLVQPHTSAGRIPTDLGYRFVVDELKGPKPLAEQQRKRLERELVEDEPISIDDLLRRASDVVSRFTHYAAAVLARRARSGRLRRLELVRVGGKMVMAVAIADNGRVEQRMIPLGSDVREPELLTLNDELNRLLAGERLEDGIGRLDERAKQAGARDRSILGGVADTFRELLGADDHVFVGGVANLAGEQSFERDDLSRLYDALERQTSVLELLASTLEEPLTVRIGTELASEDLQSCSVVVATFGGSGDAAGSIGVIGPTRMDYERVIATAHAAARLLEGALGSQGDE